MKVSGAYSFNASRDILWTKLLDPDVLALCIPGCRELERVGEDKYNVVLNVGVGAITGTYTGKVTVTEKDTMNSFKMRVEGSGTGGTITGEGVFRLDERDGGTQITLDGEARVTGLLARVGQRLMGGVSKMLIDQFFQRMKRDVEGS